MNTWTCHSEWSAPMHARCRWMLATDHVAFSLTWLYESMYFFSHTKLTDLRGRLRSLCRLPWL